MTDEVSYKDLNFTPEHYQAIGEFVVQYSLLESFFHEVFSRYAGFSRETCRAIMGGMRLKDVIHRTKRVMKLNNADLKNIANFDGIEAVLNPLSAFRDKLIHRVWVPSKEGPMLINLSGAKSKSAIIEEVITTEEIIQNTDKLLRLALFVVAHALEKKGWRDVLAILTPADRDVFLSALPKIFPEQDQKTVTLLNTFTPASIIGCVTSIDSFSLIV